MSEQVTAPSKDLRPSDSARAPLEAAILRTLAYADLFDHPLTLPEIHRYLAGVAASLPAVQEALEDGLLSDRRLVQSREYVTLNGRESIVERRFQRDAFSQRMWRKGQRYGRAIASLPFVRLVAVTGTLAMNNIEPGQDIDYLIVTAPRRVWLARLFVLFFVHLARLEKLALCPNFVFSSDVLARFEPSFFAAHELAQMMPLYGQETYQALLQANLWARQYLPNAFDADPDRFARRVAPLFPALKRAAEYALRGRLGDAWEAREREHKIAQLSREAHACGSRAAAFTADCCKGHMDDHGNRIQEAYARRLDQVGLDAEMTSLLQPPV